MYYKNIEGLKRSNFVIKNAIQIFVSVPISFIALTVLVYFSLSGKSMLYFYLTAIYILALFIFSVYSTIRMIKRQNSTISAIEIQDNSVIFNLDKILWLKQKEIKSNIAEMDCKKKIFNWYGKKTIKEGLRILINGKEFYLVKDYFDEYDSIIKGIEDFSKIGNLSK